MALIARSRNVVAVDIGSSHLKVLELELDRNGRQRMKHFGSAALPPEAIVDGAFMNTSAIVATLRELISKQRIKTRDAAVAISGNSVIIKRISLPLMTQEELEESLPWEAEQYIPFDVNDVNLDAHILSGNADEAGQMDVLLVAARKEVVNEYSSVLLEAGLKPAIVDVAAFAVYNAFSHNYDVPNDLIALINVGAASANINVLRNGVSTFTRDISTGGRVYTEEIQRALNVSHEEAEAFKVGGGDGDRAAVVPEEVERVLTSVSGNIAAEIHRSLDFYLSTAGGASVSSVYLSGGAAPTPGLRGALEQVCNCPVALIDPFKRIDVDERAFNPRFLADVATQATVAVGLALRRVDDK